MNDFGGYEEIINSPSLPPTSNRKPSSDALALGDEASCTVGRAAKVSDGIKLRGKFKIWVTDSKTGEIRENYLHGKTYLEESNMIVDEGIDEVLDKWLKGSGYTAAHYIGLTDGTPTPAAGDDMSSHAGWVEVTAYDEAARQTAAWAAVSGKSVSLSSALTFTVDTNSTTIGGLFMSTNSTKGGSTGLLMSVVAFTAGDVTLNDDDTLNVSYTISGDDS